MGQAGQQNMNLLRGRIEMRGHKFVTLYRNLSKR